MCTLGLPGADHATKEPKVDGMVQLDVIVFSRTVATIVEPLEDG